ncbi:PREDICTED: protein FAR1-RELATED SEQUENCE 1-like [Ipomoea nil]|uniref:protein FAR1-RELATED SEQUENCE 1-like n=1 Tax=Ipomoea nil TaxID=35883 RepID=UPI000901E9F4|nr:PREDICTED: protein FAR1-RELATED SEQUENCE 1-like [Ipomoea nil]
MVKRVQCDPVCGLCGIAYESILHVFANCAFAHKCWTVLNDQWRLGHVESIDEWLEEMWVFPGMFTQYASMGVFIVQTVVRSGSLQACVMDVSPDRTKFWNPSCDEAIRPFEGQVFPSLGHVIAFYRQYASVVGFDVRRNSVRKDMDGVVVKNLLVCSREGFKQSADVLVVGDADSGEARLAQKRRRVSNRVGCKASSDANVVVNKYVKKVDACPDYFFEYDLDSEDQLRRLFLVDPFVKHNFAAFGDVVSYGMVFVPFTGVDNHKKGNEMLSVEKFEHGWLEVMEKYNLVEHRWFRLMYDLRSFWIPVFFNDVFMGGLMRTTSRSEAANSVFSSFTNHHASLSELFNNLEGAIDAQRQARAKLNANCEGNFPLCKTSLLIERHAAAVYTINVFYDMQAEVVASSFSCRLVSSNVDGMVTRFEVKDDDDLVHMVMFDCSITSVEYTCNLFTRRGLLCRHIFWVFKDRRVDSIPSRYVVARWTRDACVRQLLGVQRGEAVDGE